MRSLVQKKFMKANVPDDCQFKMAEATPYCIDFPLLSCVSADTAVSRRDARVMKYMFNGWIDEVELLLALLFSSNEWFGYVTHRDETSLLFDRV
jgi:hypothetical protein